MSQFSFNRRGGFRTSITSYRSGLEDRLATQLELAGVKAAYELFSLPYTLPATHHRYTPDFVLPNGIIIEAKGIFDAEDRKKHLAIKEQYPHLDIRFVFSNAKTKISAGAKTTVGEWCEKHGYKYASKEIPAAWLKEPKRPIGGLSPKKGGAKGAN